MLTQSFKIRHQHTQPTDTKRTFKRSINKKVFSGIKQYNNSVDCPTVEHPYYNLSDISTDSDSEPEDLTDLQFNLLEIKNPLNSGYVGDFIYFYKGQQVINKPLFKCLNFNVYTSAKQNINGYIRVGSFYIPEGKEREFIKCFCYGGENQKELINFNKKYINIIA
jgi:hypothetical protein